MPPNPSDARLQQSLARLAREHPLERKLLVAPSFGAGREVLRRVALAGKGWIGIDVATPRPLAARVARTRLLDLGLTALDSFDRQALIDEALDAALSAGFDDAGLGDLAEGVGFREAVHNAVDALRLADISPRRIRQSRIRDARKRRFVARVLERYEGLLRDRRRADAATVLALAIETLDGGEPAMLGQGVEVVALLPGLETRGLTGRLIERLVSLGAVSLPTDPVYGIEPVAGRLWTAAEATIDLSYLHAPGSVEGQAVAVPIDLFAAASPTEELREVLRRAAERGLRWDQVEIVAPDARTYGSALHALASQLGVPVTYAAGLPLERTRAGRVVHAYLDWVAEGFQAHVIRRLLEAGDLRPGTRSKTSFSSADLARRFRSLRVGWGRLRYRTQVRKALAAAQVQEPRPWDTPETLDRRRGEERDELKALRSILFPALKATPSVPDHMGEGGEPVSPGELARGLSAFLRRVPRGTGPDASALDAVNARLERIETTLRRKTTFDAAITILRRHLDITVRAPATAPKSADDLGAPFRSEGGHLHLADLAHGGLSGRAAIFVVGVDAERVPGAGRQDPVLLDADRMALGGDLPTSTDRLRERVFEFAAFMARIRGSVTLSYSAWSGVDARTVAPSPALLQALRLAERNPLLDYEALHRRLGRVASPLPAHDRAALDQQDVWMLALGRGGSLANGLESVLEAYSSLAKGTVARRERRQGVPGPHHGILEPRPDAFDPRRNEGVVLSASRLEDLGACPLRYFYKKILRLYPPDDVRLDPDRWLDPLARGRLLHEVYESTLRTAKERGVKVGDSRFEALALEVLETYASAARLEIPSPGEGVLRRELAWLGEDVRSFVRLSREHGGAWAALELSFGRQNDPPMPLEIEGGTVRLSGAIDRVDENLAGLHVIDYKTGVPRNFSPKEGTFFGGRRLQHGLYAHVAESRLGREVVSGEYHFPTRRGENSVFRFSRLELASVGALIAHLLDGVAAAYFVPTNDENDCRFCDFGEICRVRTGAWGTIDSPFARWSQEHLNAGLHPQFTYLRAARTFES